jgi:hypothetical protein
MRSAVLAAALAMAALVLTGCCEGFVMEGTARADAAQWRYSSLTVLPFDVDPTNYRGDPAEGPRYVSGVRDKIVDQLGSSQPVGPAPLWMAGRAVKFTGSKKIGFIHLPTREHITLEITFLDMYGRILARGRMASDSLYEGGQLEIDCAPTRALSMGAVDFFRKHFQKI